MKILNPKKIFSTYAGAFMLLLVASIFFYTLTTRGSFGVPSPQQIDKQLNSSGQAFETSQERSRYAMVLSLFYDRTIAIDNYASMATPDLGRLNGHYYSLFPPTISAMALPLYALGLQLQMPQITVFSISTIAAFLTMILILLACRRLGIHPAIALFGALGFGFATSIWGYSVTFYAHIISAFLIMLGIYLTVFVKKNIWLRNVTVWILYGIAAYVDYPNIFIYLPIAAVLSLQGLNTIKTDKKIVLSYSWKYLLPVLLFIGMLGMYGYYNHANFGSATQFSNALPRVQDLKDADKATPERQKNNGQALKTRNIVEGLKTFTISHDRGILIYSPFVLLAAFGIMFVKKKNEIAAFTLIAVPATCLTLYSMFGDPYGGWAFGSRYLMAVFAPLCILAAAGLQRFNKNIFVKVIYSVVFLYSSAVVLLAPLTTNVIPPYVEAYGLGLDSFYTINILMLQKNQLNSLIYNTYASNSLSGINYYFLIYIPLAILGLCLIWWRKKTNESI